MQRNSRERWLNVRILAIDHSAELGGAELSLLNMSRELGADMRVLLFEDGPFAQKLAAQRTDYEIVDLNEQLGRHLRSQGRSILRPSMHRVLAEMRRAILAAAVDHNADALFFNSLRATVLASFVSWPRGLARLVAVRDGLCPPYLSPGRSALSQVSVNRLATHIFTNSKWTRSQLRTCRQSSVLFPFISRDLFEQPLTVSDDQPDVVRVLLLGRFAPWKGQLLGLQAAELMPEELSWSLTLAGGAWFSESEYYREVVEYAKTIPHVSVAFPGHVDDIVSLIDEHDIVLHTSTVPEPFGQVIAQGMARGRTVIAADAGGPAEVIEPGRTGLIYRMGSARALATALAVASRDSQLRSQIGAQARTASLEFHPSRTAARFRTLARPS
jgi:glycosyltransferase involved in cell wall biosynthesis